MVLDFGLVPTTLGLVGAFAFAVVVVDLRGGLGAVLESCKLSHLGGAFFGAFLTGEEVSRVRVWVKDGRAVAGLAGASFCLFVAGFADSSSSASWKSLFLVVLRARASTCFAFFSFALVKDLASVVVGIAFLGTRPVSCFRLAWGFFGLGLFGSIIQCFLLSIFLLSTARRGSGASTLVVELGAGRWRWHAFDISLVHLAQSVGLFTSIRLTPLHSPNRAFFGHVSTRGVETCLQLWRTKKALHIVDENEAQIAEVL